MVAVSLKKKIIELVGALVLSPLLAVFYSPWCWLFLAPLVLVTAGPAALIADRANSPLLFLRLSVLYFLYGLARSVDLVGLSPRKKSWKS